MLNQFLADRKQRISVQTEATGLTVPKFLEGYGWSEDDLTDCGTVRSDRGTLNLYEAPDGKYYAGYDVRVGKHWDGVIYVFTQKPSGRDIAEAEAIREVKMEIEDYGTDVNDLNCYRCGENLDIREIVRDSSTAKELIDEYNLFGSPYCGC